MPDSTETIKPDESRPYPQEHACRLRDPGDFTEGSFRRTTRKHDGKEYGVIMGKLKGETAMTEQTYRYDKDVWSVDSARSHCSEHDGSFEAAKSESGMRDMPPDMERRSLLIDEVELRVSDDKAPKLVGYAAKYDKWADLGYFREKISAGAFDEALTGSDVRCLKNHDSNLILGRTSAETLSIESDSVGLRFEVLLPDTTVGRDVAEEVRRKDITGCSFAFTISEDIWAKKDDGTMERTITQIKDLFDIGPVVFPAYQDTTVSARSMEAMKKNVEGETNDTNEIDEERRRRIEKGYRKAGRILNRVRPADV